MALLSVRRMVSRRERITSSRCAGEFGNCRVAAAAVNAVAGTAPSRSAAQSVAVKKLRRRIFRTSKKLHAECGMMSDECKGRPAFSFIIPHSSLITSNKLCRRAEQSAHGRCRVRLAEDRSACDENLCAGGGRVGDVVGADSAVNLYARREAALVNHSTQPPHLFERRGDELLA